MTKAAANSAAAPKRLVVKLADVMAAVERIAKRGHNDYHNYSYATEADIAEAIRKELAERHIMLIPGADAQERTPVGEKGSVLTTLRMTFTFMDGETGEEITRPWFGAGTDKEDKGLYKAFTGGEKYFLLKTFLLPTGADPEREEGAKGGPQGRAEQRERAREQSRRDAAEHGPYAERERAKAEGRPAHITADGVSTRTPAEKAAPSFAELMDRRAKLPAELQALIPTEEDMHASPPSEATENVPFMVDAVVRTAKERKISAKEWGEIMERFFGSKTARVLNAQGAPAEKLNPFFVHALYLEMDTGRTTR